MDARRRCSCCSCLFLSCIAMFITGVCESGVASGLQQAFLTPEAILEGWESNYGGIKSMRVSYTTRVCYAKPPATNPHLLEGIVMNQHVERVEEGKRYHIRYSIAEDGFAKPESLMEHAFDGKNTMEYWGIERLGTVDSGLTGRNVEFMNNLKQYMLLDLHRSKTYEKEYPDGIPSFSLSLRSAISKSTVTILPHLESVADQLSHVVEITHNGEIYKKIWVAHNKGFLPLKYHYYHDNTLEEEIEVEQIAFIENIRGGTWYPAKAYRTINSERFGIVKSELITKTFVPDLKVNENTFRFVFPDGTTVIDRVAGLQYVVGVAGNIDDVPPVHELDAEKSNNDTITEARHVMQTSTKTPGLTQNNKHLINDAEEETQHNTVVSKDHSRRFGAKGFAVAIAVVVIMCSLFLFLRHKNVPKDRRKLENASVPN